MKMTTCANCFQPMEVEHIGVAVAERCPKCGGAWLTETALEKLLHQLQQRPAKHNTSERQRRLHSVGSTVQLRTLVKIACVSFAALGLAIGVAKFYDIGSLHVPSAVATTWNRIGKTLAKESTSLEAVPANLSNWAKETARKKISEPFEKATGVPLQKQEAEAKKSTTKVE